MLADYRKLDDKDIHADVCIIGGGAAGITLARGLGDSSISVCLLESGGSRFDSGIQELYEGADVGFTSGHGLQDSRLRYLGGSTNHWVGHCAPYEALDFEVRPWVPYSGWPISRSDLNSYYTSAQQLLDLGSSRYRMADIASVAGQLPGFDANKLVARSWQMSAPTRFARKFRSDLEQMKNLSVYHHATVTELETSHTPSSVSRARIKTLDGQSGYAYAKYFVLACGGIENARILLLSNNTESGGIGNRRDLVGRFYMDHLRVEGAATAYVTSDRDFNALIKPFTADGAIHKPLLCPSDVVQEQRKSLNWCAQMSKVFPKDEQWTIAARAIRDDLRDGRWPDDFSEKTWAVLSELDTAIVGLYERLQNRPLSILGRCECAPNPDSRITLSQERDALGQNKAQRDWRLTSLEKYSIRSSMEILGEEIGSLGLGRVKVADWLLQDDNEWPDDLRWAGVHHIGTTRMASEPGQGVVDENCRVFDTQNLFISGNSVFATTGYAHPTLTNVALALRLAEHIKRIVAA